MKAAGWDGWIGGSNDLDERLNRLMAGRTLAAIEFQAGMDVFKMTFQDGLSVTISHLGGMEVEAIEQGGE